MATAVGLETLSQTVPAAVTRYHRVTAYGLPLWPSWERIRLPIQETQETQVRSLGRGDPLEERMATHSSILAWRIPWMKSLVSYGSEGRNESDTMEVT